MILTYLELLGKKSSDNGKNLLKWNWYGISSNPSITLDIILNHPELPWDWSGVSYNPNITINDVFNRLNSPSRKVERLSLVKKYCEELEEGRLADAKKRSNNLVILDVSNNSM